MEWVLLKSTATQYCNGRGRLKLPSQKCFPVANPTRQQLLLNMAEGQAAFLRIIMHQSDNGRVRSMDIPRIAGYTIEPRVDTCQKVV